MHLSFPGSVAVVRPRERATIVRRRLWPAVGCQIEHSTGLHPRSLKVFLYANRDCRSVTSRKSNVRCGMSRIPAPRVPGRGLFKNHRVRLSRAVTDGVLNSPAEFPELLVCALPFELARRSPSKIKVRANYLKLKNKNLSMWSWV